jgi:citrate lyase subunit beta/citryl-CoA lyase
MLGFDGKTLIHPAQVDPCNTAFAPTPAQITEAEALIAASSGGAERFQGRMIEAMHVEAARQMLATVALRTARRTCNTAA